MLRYFSEKTIKALNRLPKDLAALNFLPISKSALPDQAPETPFYRHIYQLLKGDLPAASNAGNAVGFAQEPPRLRALGILSILMTGNTENALKLVQDLIPKPTQLALENTVAALTYLFAMEISSGFSVPMLNIKKILHHLSRIEQIDQEPTLDAVFSRYVCGAVYVFLPGVFATRHKGVELLEVLNQELAGLAFEQFDLPAWLNSALEDEVLPALKVRINRFLAQGYIKIGENRLAAARLNAIVNQAEPDSDHAAWARLERIRLNP
jgi:hypothetical protein